MEKESIINLGEEKSVFERAIIEAFKQTTSKAIYEKLNIALDEIKYIVADIKKNNASIPNQINQNSSYLNLETGLSINSNENSEDIIIEDLNILKKNKKGFNVDKEKEKEIEKILTTPSNSVKVDLKKKYILNKNILDKFSRVIERKFFNVNILIAKIFDNLLEPENFDILSNDYNLLVNFSNEVLNLLETIKSTLVAPRLNLRCYSFLQYLIKSKNLSEDQSESINEIITNFPLRNSSETFKNFNDTREKILKLVKEENIDSKLEGLNLLMESFGTTAGLSEQLDLLYEHVFVIIKALIQLPNPEFRDAYYQLGNFICSMLFSVKFKIDAFIPEYRINQTELTKNTFFIISDDKIVNESNKNQISFLHNCVYELTTQKDLLLKCESIFKICNMVINLLAINESLFDLQFICYIILRRIYFNFPQYRENIEDNLAMVVVNLVMYKDQGNFEAESAEEAKGFILYLIKNGEESIKTKLQKRLESRGASVSISEDVDLEEIKNIEFDILRLSDFNLRVGYPSSSEIEAGNEMPIYVEVSNPNSLIYIGFATQLNDVTFHLLKYIASDEEKTPTTSTTETNNEFDENITDKGHFKNIMKLDRIDASINPVKLVLFVKEPGTYKLIWDNSFSWFTSKTLRYRLSVLRPLSQIDIERKVDFEQLREEMQKDSVKSETVTISDPANPSEFELKEIDPNENKLMMLKFEGQNRSYKIKNLLAKQLAINKNDKFISVPVIIIDDVILIYKLPYTNQKEQQQEEVNILQFKKVNFDEQLTYEIFFENQLKEFILSIPEYESKTILLNILVLEKPNLSSQNVQIAITNDEFYKQTINKIGFYPEVLLTQFKNAKLFISNLADACLINEIYGKIINEEQFNNIVHIHFDRLKSQLSMYMEGVINDRISGLNFEVERGLIDNIDNVNDFINKIVNIFGLVDISVSFSGFDEKIIELFLKELRNKVNEELKEEGKIEIYDVSEGKFLQAIRNISLFHLHD